MCQLNWLGFGIPGYPLVYFQCSSESNSFRLPWVCSCLNSKHRFNRFFATGTPTLGDRNCRLPGVGSLWAALQAKSTLRLCQPPKISCLPHSAFFLGRANLFLRDLIGREKAARGRALVRVLAAFWPLKSNSPMERYRPQ